MISIKNLYKSFGKQQVLKDVQLQVQAGKITAILGPNGSGKTTLIKSILGMALPDKGTIEVNGRLTRHSWEYRQGISYVPQIAQFPANLRVRELIDMIKAVRQQPTAEEPLIQIFGLEHYLDKKPGNLSGGTRQKVNLLLALLFDAPIVLLDEPTAGLDPVAMIELKKLIEEKRSKGKCIVITTHIMPLVQELAAEIVFLLDGKVYFQGSQSELLSLTGETRLEESIARLLITGKKTLVHA